MPLEYNTELRWREREGGKREREVLEAGVLFEEI
jgi:hypothetical protein